MSPGTQQVMLMDFNLNLVGADGHASYCWKKYGADLDCLHLSFEFVSTFGGPTEQESGSCSKSLNAIKQELGSKSASKAPMM